MTVIVDAIYQFLLRDYILLISGLGYAYFSIYKDSNGVYKGKLLHRVIYELANGSILKNYVVHHRNENKLDNRLCNLEIMSNKEHSSLHYRGKSISDVVKCKMSIARRGKRHSEYTKRLISIGNKGKNHKGEFNPMWGRHHSGETKMLLSKVKKGVKHSDEAKEKISKTLKGVKKSDVTKSRISLAMKQSWRRRLCNVSPS